MFKQNKLWNKAQHEFMSSNLFVKNRAVHEIMWNDMTRPDRPQMAAQYGACAVHAGHVRPKTHTQIMQYSLRSHCNGGYANTPKYRVIRTSPVLFNLLAPGIIFF